MRARLDGDRLVDDVAFHPCGGGQPHLQPAHAPDDAPVDDHVVGHNLALHGGAFAHGQQMRADIALDLPLDLDIAGGLEVAHDQQV